MRACDSTTAITDKHKINKPVNAEYSGCRDEQTSADVYDVSSFGLPKDSGPGGAGGACTSAIIRSLSKYPFILARAQNMRARGTGFLLNTHSVLVLESCK